MPIPSSINDLSTTAGSNSPAGSESPGLIDDYLRTYASYIAQLRDRHGRLINVQVFASIGTSSYTPTAGTNSIKVRSLGGGASAGGTQATGAAQVAASGGAQAGAYGEAYFQISALTVPVTVTIGAGGAPAAAGGNPGNAGGTTSFGTYLSCPGGSPSAGFAAAAPPFSSGGGSGGTGPAGANILGTPGSPGTSSCMLSTSAGFSGAGGSSPFGAGGVSRASTSAGAAAAGYGAGGGGALQSPSGAGLSGGAGGNGIIIIEEYA